MKASESIERYPQKIREYANYAFKNVKIACRNYGARPAGSESEKNAQSYMLSELEKYCDTAKAESFNCSDKAYALSVAFGAALLIISAALFSLGLAVASLAVAFIAAVVLVFETALKKPVTDIFFPKKTSGNVIGVRNAEEKAERRIILSGHTDSSYEYTYNYRGGKGIKALIMFALGFDTGLFFAANIAYMVFYGVIGQNVWGADINIAFKIIAVATYVTLPFLIMALFFVSTKNPVTGANTDLTGVFISMAVSKFLSDNDIRFKNTEVVVLCSGAKEAGLYGAKAFVKEHKEFFENDCETVFVGFDSIKELEYLSIGVNDENVGSLIAEAAKENGLEAKNDKIGSFTDAAVMNKAGMKAAVVTAINENANYYHTRLDKDDNISLGAVEAGVKTALEAVFLFDEKGLR